MDLIDVIEEERREKERVFQELFDALSAISETCKGKHWRKKRKIEIFKRRYGLSAPFSPQTMKETAAVYSLRPRRINQISEEIWAKLKERGVDRELVLVYLGYKQRGSSPNFLEERESGNPWIRDEEETMNFLIYLSFPTKIFLQEALPEIRGAREGYSAKARAKLVAEAVEYYLGQLPDKGSLVPLLKLSKEGLYEGERCSIMCKLPLSFVEMLKELTGGGGDYKLGGRSLLSRASMSSLVLEALKAYARQRLR